MSVISVLDRDNVPLGPFTPGEIREKLRTGDFTLDDLAYMEGLENWTPLRLVLSKAGGSTRPRPRPLAAYRESLASLRNLPYAGFGQRLMAYLLDRLIMWIPMVIVSMGAFVVSRMYGVIPPPGHLKPGSIRGLPASFLYFELGLVLFFVMANWLYFALQESSAAQATIGKRVMNLKVTDMNGKRIGFLRASGRYFGKFLSALIFSIGFIMAGFTPRRQALHDFLARTVVLRS